MVRDAVPLDLKAGINEARFSGMTAMAETDSVILRDHKKEAVEIRVVEHLSRFDNWEIKEKSNDFRSLDSHTIEFPVTLKPDEEKIVTYKVHYTW